MTKQTEQEIKQSIILDVQRLNEKFIIDNPESVIITRDFYRQLGKFKEKEVTKHFGSFSNLIDQAFAREEVDSIGFKKRIKVLEERNIILEKENGKMIKGSIIEEEMINMYKESLQKDFVFRLNNKPVIIKEDKHRTAILQLSDVHVGELVFPQYVNNVNEYNEEICIRRMDTVFNICLAYCRKFSITKLHLLLNGDLLSGGIHTELTRNMWINEVEQIFFMQNYLIKKLEYISEFFQRIDVDVIVGNHARVLPGKPYHKEKVQMNFEYILGKNLQMYFDLLSEKKHNNKIFIDVPESSFKIAEINGTRFLETHGDILMGAGSGGFAGIPFYSIAQSSAKLYGVLHQINVKEENQFDHILAGHLHTSTKIPLFNGGFCFVNGCVIGTNEFSLTKIKSVAKREQLMLIIDQEGRLEMEKNITFD